ncbi:MAG: efflux RND transporter permease subunit, partial [Desulfobulbaceae bacterium]|nr:efflux RND transporter permease subunit [Desulfobulbaceae bacterium]
MGMPIVSKALADFTEQDFLRLPPVTFFLVALILFLFFRNLRGILIPAGSVAIALIWTFGLMAVTGTPLSLLTMIVPVFLIAVGTAYCMYIFPEYLSALKTAGSPREASLQCFLKLGFPTSLAVMTTTIGLGSLLINKIVAIREFALFSCAGILFMLIIMLTFLPAVISLMPFPKTRSMSILDREGGFFDRVLSAIIKVNLHHQKKALAFIALSTAAGIIGISRIQVETNPMGFFKENTPIATHFRDIYKDMSGSFPMNVAIESGEEDFFENPTHLKKISDLQVYLGSLKGVDKTISFCDYLKLVNFAGNQYQADFYALPEESFEIRMLINNFKAMLGEDMLKRFMNPTFSKVNIMLRTHISSSKDFLEARQQIEKHLKQSFPDNFSFTVTGMGVVISQSSQLITEGQIKSLLLTLVLVFAIMFLLFMSYKVGIIGMLPNCFPIIVSFGLMGWIGIPLSMVTSLVASIAVGLAVDDTIHYLVRYNREFKKDLNKEKALRETIRHMGKPIILTTLTISLGFSVLMFSNFKPTAIFGLVIIVTMFSALIADLILLPSLMLHVELVTIWDLLKLRLGKDPQKGIPLFNGLSKTQVYYILMAGALQTHERGKV